MPVGCGGVVIVGVALGVLVGVVDVPVPSVPLVVALLLQPIAAIEPASAAAPKRRAARSLTMRASGAAASTICAPQNGHARSEDFT